MARMPGAVWRPLKTSGTPMAAYDVLCLHTMVGSLLGTDNYFRTSAPGTNSHFGVGADGTIFQWLDTGLRSGANYNGNHHIISVENADTGAPFPAWGGSDVPPFTEAQVEANAAIFAWCHETHGIPFGLIPDARPGRRGLGWHRLGVPGYMVAGAEQWSTKQGKACPGDRRIAQMPLIDTRARQITAGETQEDVVTPEDIEAIAQRTRQVIADGTLPYGLDNIRRRLDIISGQIVAADANDAPQMLTAAIVAALPEGKSSGLTIGDVEGAVRAVLGSLDTA